LHSDQRDTVTPGEMRASPTSFGPRFVFANATTWKHCKRQRTAKLDREPRSTDQRMDEPRAPALSIRKMSATADPAARRPSRGLHAVRRPVGGKLRRCVWALLLALLLPASAHAAPQHLHGVVLSLTPQTGIVIVRHDAFGGMPAMTMPFAVRPRARVRELQPGAIIDADVDTRTDPWTLRNVTSKAAQAVTANPSLRRVVPLQIGDVVPDTAFVDQAARPFRFSQLRGTNVVLAFVYTRCQDARMCPLISAKFHTLQLAPGRNVHLVEVSLDPTYDRPPVLARYAKTFGADPRRWTLAVGAADETLDFAARFGVATFPDPSAGIIHTENTVVIAPDGTIADMIADPSWTPADILAAIANEPGRAPMIFGEEPGRSSGLRALVVLAFALVALAYLVRRVYRALSAS
jgi:protein SCO1/2